MKKFFIKDFIKRYFFYFAAIFIGILFIFSLYTGKIDTKIRDFLEETENKTFDFRQRIISKYKNTNKDIIIIAIDDLTYEYITENYGEWPMPRYIYADIVNYIEKQNPKLIAFDLLFVNSINNDIKSDEKLAQVFLDYDNIYTSMNFDNMKAELRKPINIDDKFAIKVKNKMDSDIMSFINFRPILPSIMKNTEKIGHINALRNNDGVIRNFLPIVKYQDKYYPHLALIIAKDLLNSKTKNFIIDKNHLIFDEKQYPITKDGTIILNWYGDNTAYKDNTLSMAEIIKSIELEKKGYSSLINSNYFKDKIIYIGTSAPNLNDIKTVPTEKELPGVITHVTFLNNMLDNNFINKLSFKWDFTISLLLSFFIGIFMLKIEYSKINYKYLIPINISILLLTIFIYYLLSIILMIKFNLWIAVIMPTVGIALTFTSIYIIRYFFKSQDFEYTYRLATTDGLTELYNHRYFQEQMLLNIEESNKNKNKFSLILIDIDFFKKFNDQYGHQAGDNVLRQVAKILKKNVKKTDWVCRYGGEEMSIILKNADEQAVRKVAQRLCTTIAKTTFKLSTTLESNVTISIGVSTYPENGTTASELIEYADKGLYIAKENGRNQVGVVKNS